MDNDRIQEPPKPGGRGEIYTHGSGFGTVKVPSPGSSKHRVSFEVTEEEWLRLQSHAISSQETVYRTAYRFMRWGLNGVVEYNPDSAHNI